VTEGESADSFFMLKSGIISVHKDGTFIRYMEEEGASFGE